MKHLFNTSQIPKIMTIMLSKCSTLDLSKYYFKIYYNRTALIIQYLYLKFTIQYKIIYNSIYINSYVGISNVKITIIVYNSY